ncbi:PIG-L deacetylase family protein [Oribacterium sp. NK2B42]|uniref:PIG-L deacetylase family protein n=1 Tax=Oribacterium sp. NK2B42 TaxID=689781 RepID=UPI000417CBF7|nr:PIG-L deacetylase family protein [Oribacterium sp. NK2B42]
MKILVFAPHNDDEVLGVGGAISKYTKEGHLVTVCEVTSGPKYKMMQQEAIKAHKMLGVENSIFLNLPVAELADYSKTELNAKVGEVVQRIKPEIVYMPFIWDMHLDHRYVTEAVLVAIRPLPECTVKKAYMYETLSETGWNIPYGDHSFSPTSWVDIEETIEDKINAMRCYQSQIKDYPHPRSIEGIKSMAAYRGSTIGVKYAESFMLVREIN